MGSYFGNPERRKQSHEPQTLQLPSSHCCHTHLTRQAKRCLLSELLKTTFPVPLQELMFPSSSLQVFHPGGNITSGREDLEQCLQEGLISQCLCRDILMFVQPASLQAQSTRDPGDKQHSAQQRELPWEYQWGLKGNTPAGRFSCSDTGSIWDLPHLLPMNEQLPTDGTQSGSGCEATANTTRAATTVLSCLVLHFRYSTGVSTHRYSSYTAAADTKNIPTSFYTSLARYFPPNTFHLLPTFVKTHYF